MQVADIHKMMVAEVRAWTRPASQGCALQSSVREDSSICPSALDSAHAKLGTRRLAA